LRVPKTRTCECRRPLAEAQMVSGGVGDEALLKVITLKRNRLTELS
jgi:hypothetical protein